MDIPKQAKERKARVRVVLRPMVKAVLILVAAVVSFMVLMIKKDPPQAGGEKKETRKTEIIRKNDKK